MGRRSEGAKVYRVNNKSNPWQVYLNQPGKKPFRKHFKTEKEAVIEQKRLNDTIAVEGIEGVVFGAEARAEYIAAKRLIEGHGVSLVDLARDWIARHPSTTQKPFIDAIDDFVMTKERANRRPATLREIRYRLREFQLFSLAETVNQVSSESCEDYLARPHLSPASIKRYYATLSSFFDYCRKRNWLAIDPLMGIEKPTIDAKEPAILSPEEADRFIRECRKLKDGRIVRAVALRLFAGLRPGEQEILREQDILSDGIRVAQGKIRGRRAIRIVPISITLHFLLNAYPRSPLKPTNFRKLQEQAIEQSGLSKIWVKDILRHTWISYRLAETNDERQVAREAGNSPDVIYRHYYQLVSAGDVEKFARICQP
ncbi:MAG: phage integrase SAM-like domain-containing protein [Verrucomicrobiota bacterium]